MPGTEETRRISECYKNTCFLLGIASFVTTFLMVGCLFLKNFEGRTPPRLFDLGTNGGNVEVSYRRHRRAESNHTTTKSESAVHETLKETRSTVTTTKPNLALHETNLLLHNPSCQILDYAPFHAAVMPFYHKMRPRVCTRRPLLTSTTLSDRKTGYTLNLHPEHFHLYSRNGTDPVCKYCTVNASVQAPYEIEDCHPLHTNIALDPTKELVLVSCTVDRYVCYKNAHFLVAVKPDISHKMNFKNEKDEEEALSVMILGIDSVSRLSLLRNMPKTVQVLKNRHWYPLNVYHKIKDYTWNNLIGPVLAGKLDAQLKATCWPDKKTPLDSCPWIWKNFSQRNYITAYGEESPKIDSFTFTGKLERQPTDYYMRPLLIAAEKIFKIKKYFPLCIGPSSSAQNILNYSEDFARRFVAVPTFSLFWMNAFSHEFLNGPSMVDKLFEMYWDRMEKSGVLNRTMVVFMSDHGCQREGFRKTYEGTVEESLPFMYIRLPEWFEDKYPSKVINLIRNKNRLTSHFDLHVTLMDVLGVKTVADGCPKCVSLFDLVPWNRSCSDAGIHESACACPSYRDIPKDSRFVKRMAEVVISRINQQKLATQNGMELVDLKNVTAAKLVVRRRINHRLDDQATRLLKCRLSLKRIIDTKDSGFLPKRYIIQVTTVPGDAVFEAAVLHHVSFNITSLIRLDQA